MTSEARLERGLAEWFSSDASAHPPIDLHASAMARVRRARQRPALLVLVRGDRISGADRSLSRARTLVLVGAALLLVALAALLVIGARTPDVAPNGANSWITYVVTDSASPRTYSIWRVLGDGTGDHQIGLGECPIVSANGASMLFVSGRAADQEGQMIVAKSDGSEQRVLADVEASTGALSPDGSAVAWVKKLPITSADGKTQSGFENELWVSPLSGPPGMRIVPRGTLSNVRYRGLAWSTRGDRIAFVQYRVLYDGSTGLESIWVVDAEGSDLHQVASWATPGSNVVSVAWSPDGRWLAYARYTGADYQLMVVAVDGSVETAVAAAADPPQDPTWSPNGRYLAYRDPAGIATIEMSGGVAIGPPNHGITESGGRFYNIGAWSPDSRDLLVAEVTRVGPGQEQEDYASRLVSVDATLQGPTTLVLDRARIAIAGYPCALSWRAP